MTQTGEPLVMVVDDDAGVRRAVGAALERSGCRVLVAENGLDALAQLEAAGELVRVIVTDVVMPKMGGVALAERALARVPPSKVILMSGLPHAAESLVVSGQKPRFLQKPFAGESIAKAVWAELDAG